MTRSEERIASNILADRLTRLEKAGLVSRRDDPSHKQKVIYSLTEASIALVPLLAHMGGVCHRLLPLDCREPLYGTATYRPWPLVRVTTDQKAGGSSPSGRIKRSDRMAAR